MATPGKPIDEMTRKRIVRLAESRTPIKQIARLAGVARNTARRYVRLAINRYVGPRLPK